jgi:virulence factor Mce-like protein
MRRQNRSAFASPVLIGAVTVLIVLVAVFLAYNANQGLPFVPTTELKVDIANGSDLVVGNDVREGGYRVGLVSALKPIELASGQVGAQLTLQLNNANGKVPIDSTVAIRPESLLGTKYVDITTGTSNKYFQSGATLPIARTTVPVQLDDIFRTFNSKTRVAVQQGLAGYGNALAGRGSDLNDTIAALPSLFGHLTPVAKYLSDPSSELTRFIGSLNQFMSALAPVAHTNVLLFRDAATTFAALAKNPSDLEQTIAKSPSTLAVGTDSLRTQQPFLTDLTTLGSDLTPATASLHAALPVINPAIEQGTRVLGRTPQLDRELEQVMTALKNLAQAPGTNVAVNGLVSTVNTLNPMIRYLGPFQTVCDDWNYWWTYYSEHISSLTAYGMAQRAMINLGSIAGNGVGQQGANAPANGVPPTIAGLMGGTEYLHAQPYGAAIDNQGNADCETGQRGYPLKLNHLDPQGRNLATDPRTPGDQGPTFHGRTRVPAGETFSRNPQTGPQLPVIPQNP